MKLQPRCTLSHQGKHFRPNYGGSGFRLAYSPPQHGEVTEQQQDAKSPWNSFLGVPAAGPSSSDVLFLLTTAGAAVVCSCTSAGLPGADGYEIRSVQWQDQADTGTKGQPACAEAAGQVVTMCTPVVPAGKHAWSSPAGHSILLDAGSDWLLFTPTAVHSLQLPSGGDGLMGDTVNLCSLQQVHIADGGFGIVTITSSAAGQQLHVWTAPAEGSPPMSAQGVWRQLPLWPHCSAPEQLLGGSRVAVSSFSVAFPRFDMSGQWMACAAVEAVAPGELVISVLQQPLLSVIPGAVQLLQPITATQQDMQQGSGGSSSDQQWTWQSLCLLLPGQTQSLDSKQELDGLSMGTLHLSSSAADSSAPCEVQSTIMAWHPAGTKLAVGLSSSGDKAWLLVFASGMQELHEYRWEDTADNRPTGLMHPGPRALSSLCWLMDGDMLAVIDTWGQLKILGADNTLEQLQLIDLSGMTITFKPTVQLSYSMLLAACSSATALRPSFDRSFLLCGIPAAGPGQPSQLAVWDGSSLLVCNLLPGVDPSQHLIDQTINARAHLLHGDTNRRMAHQREQERLHAMRCSVMQRVPELSVEAVEQGAGASLLSCAPGPSVLQVVLEVTKSLEITTEAQGSQAVQQVLPVPVLANPLVTVASTSEPLQVPFMSSSSGEEATPATIPLGDAATDCTQSQLQQAAQQPSSNLARLQSGVVASSDLLPVGNSSLDAVQQASLYGGASSWGTQEATGPDYAGLWQLLRDGDHAFFNGNWPAATAAYQQAWPLSAGHLMALHLCQYNLPGALLTAQRTVAEALATVVQHESAVEPDSPEAAIRSAAAAVLAPLCGLLCGAMCQTLMACIVQLTDHQPPQQQQEAAAGINGAQQVAGGLCLAGSPLYWTVQLMALLQPEECVDTSWTPGHYVHLVPQALLAAAQMPGAAPQDAPSTTGPAAALHQLPARAAGYAVLAAAWSGGSLEQLPFAAAAALHQRDAWGNGNWLAAAVLADACSKVLHSVLAEDITAEEQAAKSTWDDAARCCLLWRLVDFTGAPLPVLADAAVEVVAAAHKLWGSEHESCQRVMEQVHAHLWRCICLRVACAPVLPPATSSNTSTGAASAVDGASATDGRCSVHQQLLCALLSHLQHHQAATQCGVVEEPTRTGASFDAVLLQLLQQLLWYTGSSLQATDLQQQVLSNLVEQSHVQAALGAVLTNTGLCRKVQWQQVGQHPPSSQPVGEKQLAELSLQVDVLCLSRALLRVAAHAQTFDDQLQQLLSQAGAAVALPTRLEMPGLSAGAEDWQGPGCGPCSSAPMSEQAMQQVALISYLLECRQQAGQLLNANGGGSPASCAAAAALLSMDRLHPPQLLQHAVLPLLVKNSSAVPLSVLQAVEASCASEDPGSGKTAALLQQLKADCEQRASGAVAFDTQQDLTDMLGRSQMGRAGERVADGGTFLQAVLTSVSQSPALANACCQLPQLGSCFVHPLCTSVVATPEAVRLSICAAMLHPATAAEAVAAHQEDGDSVVVPAVAWQQQQVEQVLVALSRQQLAGSPATFALEEFLQPAISQLSLGDMLHADFSAASAAPSAGSSPPPAVAAAMLPPGHAAASEAPARAAAAAGDVGSEAGIKLQPAQAPQPPEQGLEQPEQEPKPQLQQSKSRGRPAPLQLGTNVSSSPPATTSRLSSSTTAVAQEASGISAFFGHYSAPSSPNTPRRAPTWAPAAAAAATAAASLAPGAGLSTPRTLSRLTRLVADWDGQQQRFLHGLPSHLLEASTPRGGAAADSGADAPMTPRRAGLRLQPMLRNFSLSARVSGVTGEVPPTPGISRLASTMEPSTGMQGVAPSAGRRASTAGSTEEVAPLQSWPSLPANYSLQLLQESSQQLINQQRYSLGATFHALLPEELRVQLPPIPSSSDGYGRRRTTDDRGSIPGIWRRPTVSSGGTAARTRRSTDTEVLAGAVPLLTPRASAAGTTAPAAGSRRSTGGAQPATQPAPPAAAGAGGGSGGPVLQRHPSRAPQAQQQLGRVQSSAAAPRRTQSSRHTLAAVDLHQELLAAQGGLQVLVVPELGSQQQPKRVSNDNWLLQSNHPLPCAAGRVSADQVAADSATQHGQASSSSSQAGGRAQAGQEGAPATCRSPGKSPSGQLLMSSKSPSRQHSAKYSSSYETRELSRRKMAAALARSSGGGGSPAELAAAGKSHPAAAAAADGTSCEEGTAAGGQPLSQGHPVAEAVEGLDASSIASSCVPTGDYPAAVSPAVGRLGHRRAWVRFTSWVKQKLRRPATPAAGAAGGAYCGAPVVSGQPLGEGVEGGCSSPVKQYSWAVGGQPLGEGVEVGYNSPIQQYSSAAASPISPGQVAQLVHQQEQLMSPPPSAKKEVVRESVSYQSIPQLMSIMRKLFAANTAPVAAAGGGADGAAAPIAAAGAAGTTAAPSAAAAGDNLLLDKLGAGAMVSAAEEGSLAEYLGCFSPAATSRAPSRGGSRPGSSRSLVGASRGQPGAATPGRRSASPSRSGSRLLGGGSRDGGLHRGLVGEPAAGGDPSGVAIPATGSLPNLDDFWNESSVYSLSGSQQNSRAGSFKQRPLQQQVLEQQQRRTLVSAATQGPSLSDFWATSHSGSGGSLDVSQRVPLNPMRVVSAAQGQDSAASLQDFFATSHSGAGESMTVSQRMPKNPLLAQPPPQQQQDRAVGAAATPAELDAFLATSRSGMGAALLASQKVPNNPMWAAQGRQASATGQQPAAAGDLKDFLATSRPGTDPEVLLASQRVPGNPLRQPLAAAAPQSATEGNPSRPNTATVAEPGAGDMTEGDAEQPDASASCPGTPRPTPAFSPLKTRAASMTHKQMLLHGPSRLSWRSSPNTGQPEQQPADAVSPGAAAQPQGSPIPSTSPQPLQQPSRRGLLSFLRRGNGSQAGADAESASTPEQQQQQLATASAAATPTPNTDGQGNESATGSASGGVSDSAPAQGSITTLPAAPSAAKPAGGNPPQQPPASSTHQQQQQQQAGEGWGGLAGSMQRIAHCLEEFLVQRSPVQSPYATGFVPGSPGAAALLASGMWVNPFCAPGDPAVAAAAAAAMAAGMAGDGIATWPLRSFLRSGGPTPPHPAAAATTAADAGRGAAVGDGDRAAEEGRQEEEDPEGLQGEDIRQAGDLIMADPEYTGFEEGQDAGGDADGQQGQDYEPAEHADVEGEGGQLAMTSTMTRMLGTAGDPRVQSMAGQLPRGLQQAQQLLQTQRTATRRRQQQPQYATGGAEDAWRGGPASPGGEEEEGEEEEVVDEAEQQHMAYLTAASEAAGVPVEQLERLARRAMQRSTSRTAQHAATSSSHRSRRGVTFADAAEVLYGSGEFDLGLDDQSTDMELQEQYLPPLQATVRSHTQVLSGQQLQYTHQPGMYQTRRGAGTATTSSFGAAEGLPGLNTRIHSGDHLRILRTTKTTPVLRHISVQPQLQGEQGSTAVAGPADEQLPAAADGLQDPSAGQVSGLQHSTQQQQQQQPVIGLPDYLNNPRLVRPSSMAGATASMGSARKALFAAQRTGASQSEWMQQTGGQLGNFDTYVRTLDVSATVDQGAPYAARQEVPGTMYGSSGPRLWLPPDAALSGSVAVRDWIKSDLGSEGGTTRLRATAGLAGTVRVTRSTRLLGRDIGEQDTTWDPAVHTVAWSTQQQPTGHDQQQQQQQPWGQGAAAPAEGAEGPPDDSIAVLGLTSRLQHPGTTTEALQATMHSSFVPGAPAFWDDLQEQPAAAAGGSSRPLAGTATARRPKLLQTTTAAAAAAAAAEAEAASMARQTLAARLKSTGWQTEAHSGGYAGQPDVQISMLPQQQQQAEQFAGTSSSSSPRATTAAAVSPRRAVAAAAAARRRRSQLRRLAGRHRGTTEGAASAIDSDGQGDAGLDGQQQGEVLGDGGDAAARLLQAAGQLLPGTAGGTGSPLSLAALDAVRGTDFLLQSWQAEHAAMQQQQQQQQPKGLLAAVEQQQLADSISFGQLPGLKPAPRACAGGEPQPRQPQGATGPTNATEVTLSGPQPDQEPAAQQQQQQQQQQPPQSQFVASGGAPAVVQQSATQLVSSELLLQALVALQEQQRTMSLALASAAAAPHAAPAARAAGAALLPAQQQQQHMVFQEVQQTGGSSKSTPPGEQGGAGSKDAAAAHAAVAVQQHVAAGAAQQQDPPAAGSLLAAGENLVAMMLGATAAATLGRGAGTAVAAGRHQPRRDSALTEQHQQNQQHQQQQQEVGPGGDPDPDQTAAELAQLILHVFEAEGGIIAAEPSADGDPDQDGMLQPGQLIGPDEPYDAGLSTAVVGPPAAQPMWGPVSQQAGGWGGAATAAAAPFGPSILQVTGVSDLAGAPPGFLAGAPASALPLGRPNGWIRAVGASGTLGGGRTAQQPHAQYQQQQWGQHSQRGGVSGAADSTGASRRAVPQLSRVLGSHGEQQWQQQQQMGGDRWPQGEQQHQERWDAAVTTLQAAGLPLQSPGEQQQWQAGADRRTGAGAGFASGQPGAAGSLQEVQHWQQHQQQNTSPEDEEFAAERASLRQALAKAEAARATARAAAKARAEQQAARLKAELGDLCSMLQDVDRLAAVMQEESAAVAAALEGAQGCSAGGATGTGLSTMRSETSGLGGFGRQMDGASLHGLQDHDPRAFSHVLWADVAAA